MNRKQFSISATAASALFAASYDIPMAASAAPTFRFRSGFWQNLNHTLCYQSQVLETVYGGGTERLSPMDSAAFTDMRRAVAVDSDVWNEGLRAYHDHYARLNFVFSDQLVSADNALAVAGEDLPANVPQPMRQVLASAARVYRASLWQDHDASNASFVAALQRALDPLEIPIASKLAAIYRTPWLPEPIVVDVVQYAHFLGSYSNNADGFVHVVMSARDPQEQGLSGVDVLFHETSHSVADPQYGTIGSAIIKAAAAHNSSPPDQFWHSVIMYTPGKLVERLARERGKPYTMVWMQPALFGREWTRYYDALERYWLPYMQGSGSLDSALAHCVNEIVTV